MQFIVQIGTSWDTIVKDDQYNDLYGEGTVKEIFVKILDEFSGKAISFNERSAIVKFYQYSDAESFNQEIHNWLSPRMFLDTQQSTNRYRYMAMKNRTKIALLMLLLEFNVI